MKSFDPELISMLERHGIDHRLTAQVLERINRGEHEASSTDVARLPAPDDPRIIDTSHLTCWKCARKRVDYAFEVYDIPRPLAGGFEEHHGSYIIDRRTLRLIGMYLLPRVSYGVLNGGSATSYVDEKKNRGFSEAIFSVYREVFDRYAPDIRDLPKGLTPGFFGERPGPTFVLLKLRALLVAMLKRSRVFGNDAGTAHPMFQMTNNNNNELIAGALEEYSHSPLLASLIEQTGIEATNVLTGVQPLIAAFTHSDMGPDRSLFLSAYGTDSPLALPGGHGQCFAALHDVFLQLRDEGIEFVQIGNVDNLGNLIDEVHVALLALSGAPGGFDFARRTPMDVKGGILVETSSGGLSCVDIGPAIGFDRVTEFEKSGTPALFNCATGLFSLPALLESYDTILRELPVRLSDQDKDAGKYSQAEQITWEVIGILDDPLIFSVRKYDRFIAAKLFVENLLTSGLMLDSEIMRKGDEHTRRVRSVAQYLNEGLIRRLVGAYGLRYRSPDWISGV